MSKHSPIQITQECLEDLDRRDFLNAVHARGVGKNIEEVRQWWFHFCNEMFDWLVNKERPVDFYFIKLHQSPYRQDWKDIVTRSVAHHRNSPEVLRDNQEILRRMTQLDLLAVRGPCCLRNVEVEHLLLWWTTLSKAERNRMKKLGPNHYAKVTRDSVLRRLSASVRIYAEYIRQVGAPFPADVQDGPGGKLGLRTGKGRQVCHWHRPPRDRLPGSLLDVLEKPAPEPKRVRGSDGDLSGMSDLQRAFQELRDAWDIVPEPGDRKA